MEKKKSIIILLICGVMWFGGCDGEEEMQYFSAGTDITYEESSVQNIPDEGKSDTLMVYVCGAVENPGVVELKEDSRVVDAVEMAGGMTPEADETYVNLAARLRDGEKVYIPTLDEVASWENEQQKDDCVNINTADADVLSTLPGIGQSKAASIIAYREKNGAFQSIEELMEVPGIKESLFRTIEDRISVE